MTVRIRMGAPEQWLPERRVEGRRHYGGSTECVSGFRGVSPRKVVRGKSGVMLCDRRPGSDAQAVQWRRVGLTSSSTEGFQCTYPDTLAHLTPRANVRREVGGGTAAWVGRRQQTTRSELESEAGSRDRGTHDAPHDRSRSRGRSDRRVIATCSECHSRGARHPHRPAGPTCGRRRTPAARATSRVKEPERCVSGAPWPRHGEDRCRARTLRHRLPSRGAAG